MPLTRKGTEIADAMRKHYGSKKGKQVFYASAKKGTIKGVHTSSRPGDKKKKHNPGSHKKMRGY